MKTRAILSLLMIIVFFDAKSQVSTTTLAGDYKIINIGDNTYGDYTRSLILLHEIYNGTLINHNYAIGTITAMRGDAGGGNRQNVVNVTTSSAYSGISGTITSNDDYSVWGLKTCIYNGKRYLAVDIPYNPAYHSWGYYFSGWTTSTGENMKCVSYEVSGVPVNTTLISNIQDFSSNMVETHNVAASIFTGNVGIGTTSPIGNLDIRGASFIGTSDFSIGSAGSMLQIDQGASSGNTYSRIRAFSNGGTAVNNLVLQSSGGNVGIGTTTPLWLLHLKGASPAMNFEKTGILNWSAGNLTGNNFTIMPDSYTGSISTFNITASGDIGIGTTTPSRKLSVVVGTGIVPFATQAGSGGEWSFGNNVGTGSGDDTFGFYSNTFGTSHSSAPILQMNSANGNVLLAPNSGNVAIGTTDPKGYKLAVAGDAITESMTVDLQANWPDYAFKKDYRLMPLADLKAYVDENQHLPEVPTAEQVKKDGINLGEMNTLLMKKVEELTLYLIEKDKQDKIRQQEIEELKKQVEALTKATRNHK